MKVMIFSRSSLLILISILFFACEKDDPLIPEPVPKGIVFLGHTYQWGAGPPFRVDTLLEKVDFSQYEQVWLGGDITSETTKYRNTLDYLDDLFDLSKPNHHWAVGNHDTRNGNWNWISEVTGRPLFYTHSQNGLTVMVLNTSLKPDTDCEALDQQAAMIKQVTDTISASTHLVILTHFVIWGFVESNNMRVWESANANYHFWKSSCSDPDQSQFHFRIYPMLAEVQSRGVQVVCISGDFGMLDKSYEYQTQEGIWFLGAGMNNSHEKDPEKRAQLPPDRILYLEHDPIKRRLYWEFKNVELL